MSNNLWERINYLIDKPYILSSNIYEYDISKANINILRSMDMITEQEYNNFLIMDKMSREVIIGERIREEREATKTSTSRGYSVTYDTIKNGIIEAKRQLFLHNKLSDDSIIRIANDAVYVQSIGPLQYTDFIIGKNNHPVSFIYKGNYRSMIILNKILVLYNIDQTGNFVVDIKGINDEKIHFHEKMLEFICEMIFLMESGDKNTTLYRFNSFYESYIKRDLELDYYREFNEYSCFRIKNSRVGTLFLDPKYKNYLDISYNISILRQLYSYILSI